MSRLGSIITAAVTPFDAAGRVDEEAFVALLGHLAAHGSDGVVVAGTTGESSTLTTEEHVALVALAVAEKPTLEFTVIGGAGSNDTAHAVAMTRAVCEAGVDAVLSVTPYYNRPNRRGLLAHYAAVDEAADRPIVLYNIPQRTGTNMAPDLLAELAQLEHVSAVKQACNEDLRMIDGLELYAGNDEVLAATLDLGGAGGILTASHVVGPEMRRMLDEPAERAAIHEDLLDVFTALAVAPAAVSVKAALGLLGHRVGEPRLPYVAADEEETATIRAMLAERGLLSVAAR